MEKQLEEPPSPEPMDSKEDVGPPLETDTSSSSEKDNLSLLLRLRAQTKQQLLEYKSMVDANKENTLEQITEKRQIKTKIEDLENKIEEVKIDLQTKKLILNRVQLSAALKKYLEKSDTKTSVLLDNMKHILKLNNLIMKLQQESWDLEEKLLNVRKKRLQLKQTSESKFLEIQTEKNKQKEDLDRLENSDKMRTIHQRLQMEIHITTVIQHVFQNLIWGSKINWAKDPALKEIVLQLERNLAEIK